MVEEVIIECLKVKYNASFFKARCNIWIQANNPIMTNKLDEEGNLVKNKVTGETEKEPLKDENGEVVYVITKEEAEKELKAIDDSVKTCIALKTPAAKVLTNKVIKMGLQTAAIHLEFGLMALAIVVTTPMGPGVASHLIPSLMKQLIFKAQELSSLYDDVEKTMNDLELNDETVNAIRSISISTDDIDTSSLSKEVLNAVLPRMSGWVAEVMPLKEAAASALEALNNTIAGPGGFMEQCQTACTMYGADCGGKKGSEPPLPKPPISVECKPQDCTNYEGEYKDEHQDQRTADNCRAYEALDKEGERSCNNCKHFNK